MAAAKTPVPLSQATLQDLKRSGLNAKDAASMGIKDVSAEWCARHVGQGFPGYVIPYRNLDHQVIEDFYRVKFPGEAPEPRTFAGHEVTVEWQKYKQPKGTGVMAYLSKRIDWRKTLANKSTNIVLTEGEKKAEAVCKAGVVCVGLGGVDSIKNMGGLLETLAQLAAGRKITICFDSDRVTKKGIQDAEVRLATELWQAGASVSIATIPATGEAKVGLDDLLVSGGKKAVDAVLNAAVEFTAQKRTHYLVGVTAARPTRDELLGVPAKPKMIVEGYLQEDAGGDVGTGGAGKTTLILAEAVHVILGRPLYGRQIVRPGGVLMVTAEDSREITLSRLNQICNAMDLTKADQKRVLNDFYVEDISASDAKLVEGNHTGIHATGLVDELITHYSKAGLAFVALDPTSLLGPGETYGNDGMAQLMRTARALNKELSAAARLVHHVAQQVARNDIRDQHAGRGGSAFADNSRSQRQIVRTVTRKFSHEGSDYELPQEIPDIDIARGNVLAIYVHKLSYAARDSTPIIVVRNGFAFKHVPIDRVDNSETAKANRRDNEMYRVVDYVRGLLLAGKKIGRRELEEHTEQLGLVRQKLREARDMALNMGALVELKLPQNERVTNRKDYLAPPENANAANPAESGRDSSAQLGVSRTVVAANPAAAVHAIAAAGLESGKPHNPAGDEEAPSELIRPNAAARKTFLHLLKKALP
jgi:regulatory protein RepA